MGLLWITNVRWRIILIPRKKIISRIARLIGIMTAYTQGLTYAGAHIKSIEIDKNGVPGEFVPWTHRPRLSNTQTIPLAVSLCSPMAKKWGMSAKDRWKS
jgi:hypothetical protein